MKIALVRPKFSIPGEKQFPMGIVSIASTLADAGYRCDIIDFQTSSSSIDELRKYDVVGLSCLSMQLEHAVELVDGLRNHVKIVWGGVHPLLDPESILNRYPESYCIRGDGEIPFLDYIRRIERADDPREVEGIAYSEKGKIIVTQPFCTKDLNTLVRVDYLLHPQLETYFNTYDFYLKRNLLTLCVSVGRGCRWDCSFCIQAIYHRMGFHRRAKSMQTLLSEIEPVLKMFTFQAIQIFDDDFFADRKFVEEWMEFTGNHKLLWGATCRFNYFKPNYIDEDFTLRLIHSGCYFLSMSVEAADENLRNNVLHKRLKDSEIDHALSVLHPFKKQISFITSFIVFFPGDTKQNRIKTIQFMYRFKKIMRSVFGGAQIYRPYPGSPMYESTQSPTGDINHYINIISRDGAIAHSPYHTYFSKFLFYYFISDFICPEPIFPIPSNQLSVVPQKRKYKLQNIKYRFYRVFIDLYCILLKLRIKFNFWKFFIDPYIAGKLVQLYTTPEKVTQQEINL